MICIIVQKVDLFQTVVIDGSLAVGGGSNLLHLVLFLQFLPVGMVQHLEALFRQLAWRPACLFDLLQLRIALRGGGRSGAV